MSSLDAVASTVAQLRGTAQMSSPTSPTSRDVGEVVGDVSGLLELTTEHAIEELTKCFQTVGRLQAHAIVTQAPDVLGPLADKAKASLQFYVERVEAMRSLGADRHANKKKRAAAEAESRVRRGWLNEVQRLLVQVEQARKGDVSGGVGGPGKPPSATGSGGAVRVGRGAGMTSRTTAELIASPAIRSELAEPVDGAVSFAGKVIADPTVVLAVHDGVNSNVSTLVSLSLASCDLNDESMDFIANALAEHPTLTALDLSDNQLTGAGAESLVTHVLAPSEPGKKRQTKTKTQKDSNLETGNIVHLSWESTKTTPEKIIHGELVEGPGIKTLDLSENPLGTDGARSIGEALGMNASLKSVAMRGVGLGPRGASSIARFGIERQCGLLGTLDLARNGIGDAGAAAIASGMKGNPGTITSLDLTSNEIGQVGLVESRLSKLYLGGNPITLTGLSMLAEEAKNAAPWGSGAVFKSKMKGRIGDFGKNSGLKQREFPPGLCELYLPGCNLSPPEPMEAAHAGTAVKEVQKSAVFGAGAEEALHHDADVIALMEEEEGAQVAGVYWSRFIAATSLVGRSLTALELKNNCVDDTMVAALSSAWQFHARTVRNNCGDNLLRVKWMDLSRNPIGDEGVEALAGAIGAGAAPNLEWLSLASLQFGGKGACAMAVALGGTQGIEDGVDYERGGAGTASKGMALGRRQARQKATTAHQAEEVLAPGDDGYCGLKTLILSGNRVGSTAKAALATALQRNPALTDLQMSRMQWDDAGAVLLAAAIGANTNLLNLDLGGNAMGLQGICTLGWALSEKNQTMTSLGLWNNFGLSITGHGGVGEERSDIDEVLSTIQHTLDDNARLTIEKGMAADESQAEIERERAHAEQERVSALMLSVNESSSSIGIGDMPSSSDEEQGEPEGEVVWEGVRDGQML